MHIMERIDTVYKTEDIAKYMKKTEGIMQTMNYRTNITLLSKCLYYSFFQRLLSYTTYKTAENHDLSESKVKMK